MWPPQRYYPPDAHRKGLGYGTDNLQKYRGSYMLFLSYKDWVQHRQVHINEFPAGQHSPHLQLWRGKKKASREARVVTPPPLPPYRLAWSKKACWVALLLRAARYESCEPRLLMLIHPKSSIWRFLIRNLAAQYRQILLGSPGSRDPIFRKLLKRYARTRSDNSAVLFDSILF